MPFYKYSLPFHYETEPDPVVLENSLERKLVWSYCISEQTNTDGQRILIENVQQRTRYEFDNIVVSYRSVHEWLYDTYNVTTVTDLPNIGYRFYHQGKITKDAEPYLQPEVAIVLGFTPAPDIMPPYIETTSLESLRKLMQTAEEKFEDDCALNAWLSVPVAAPEQAPEDIYQTLRKMRGDMGLRPTRGRGKLLQYVMEEAGVILDINGWGLTEQEAERRKRLLTESSG